jgi:hypothetical protein
VCRSYCRGQFFACFQAPPTSTATAASRSTRASLFASPERPNREEQVALYSTIRENSERGRQSSCQSSQEKAECMGRSPSQESKWSRDLGSRIAGAAQVLEDEVLGIGPGDTRCSNSGWREHPATHRQHSESITLPNLETSRIPVVNPQHVGRAPSSGFCTAPLPTPCHTCGADFRFYFLLISLCIQPSNPPSPHVLASRIPHWRVIRRISPPPQ